MLSRVAESLYWAARYLERAEDVTRLLDVNFHALLDGEVADRGASWQQLVAVLGDDGAYLEHHEDYTARERERLGALAPRRTPTPSRPASSSRARTPARCASRSRARCGRRSTSSSCSCAAGRIRRPGELHSLFGELRSYAHLFQGAADATMEHGEAYEFIRLGLHLERAEKTARIVGARYPGVAALDENDPFRPRALGDLLRSCSAFEAYVRRHGTSFEPVPVAEELVRSPDSPRSVRHLRRQLPRRGRADRRATTARRAGCSDGWRPSSSSTSRSTSRGRRSRAAMTQLLGGINAVGESRHKTYFASRAVPVAAITAQEVQQQQCG